MSSRVQSVIAIAPNQPTYRLLIVEDQAENSQFLLQLLTNTGFVVALAHNGQEAIDLWQEWEPDLILMDMRMPVMNGYEATQRIKSTVKGQKTVIIAVTGSAFEEDRAQILAVGCDDFIRKPFQLEEIFAKLGEHLDVQYLYEDAIASEVSDSYDCLTRAALTVMPQNWLDQLRLAASGCSDRQVLELIEQIPAHHEMLARSLTELTHNFCFEEIVELTSPVTP